MAEKSMIKDLTTGSAMKQLLVFALPLMLANLLQQIYNMVDMIIVGQFVGSAGLTAVSVGGDITALFLFISLGFSAAGQIVISQHIGSGDRDKVSKTIGTMFTLLFIFAVVLTAFCLPMCRTFVHIMNVPDEAVDYCWDYSFIYLCGMIPVFGYNAVSATLRGMGDSKHPFIFISIAAVINIILDIVFVAGLGMKTFGAGLATVIGQTVSFVISVVFLVRHRESFGFDFKLKSFAMDRTELRAITKMGIPITVQSICAIGSILVLSAFINACGLTAAAVTAVGSKITLVATLCTDAVNTAGNSMIGQAFAAGKIKRVGIIYWYVMIVGLIFCGALALIVALFPEQVFSLFDKSPEVLTLCHSYIPMCIVTYLGFPTRVAALSLVNGIGNSKFAFIAGMIDGILVRVCGSILFGYILGLGIKAYWWAGAAAASTIGIIGIVYFLTGKWKNSKALV